MPLAGTPKQVAWAEDVRRDILCRHAAMLPLLHAVHNDLLKRAVESGPVEFGAEMSPAVSAGLIELPQRLARIVEAEWFVDNRGLLELAAGQWGASGLAGLFAGRADATPDTILAAVDRTGSPGALRLYCAGQAVNEINDLVDLVLGQAFAVVRGHARGHDMARLARAYLLGPGRLFPEFLPPGLRPAPPPRPMPADQAPMPAEPLTDREPRNMRDLRDHLLAHPGEDELTREDWEARDRLNTLREEED